MVVVSLLLQRRELMLSSECERVRERVIKLLIGPLMTG